MDKQSFPTQLYSRSEVASRIGASDDLLAYWLKEGMLIPAEGGSGRGNRRRFAFHQVNVAAVLNQVRSFGANIAALKGLADHLQRGLALTTSTKLSENDQRTARHLSDLRREFDQGNRRVVYDLDLPTRQQIAESGHEATTLQEQYDPYLAGSQLDSSLEQVMAFANSLSDDAALSAEAGADLVSRDQLVRRRDEMRWTMWRDASGKWFTVDSEIIDNPRWHGVVPVVTMTLTVSRLIRDLWPDLATLHPLLVEEGA